MTRHLKIFISSTFTDMQEEREILLKETFLELKKIAKSRAVKITEIDLRTGVTKQQAQSGQIVKICLDEIERCSDSPIFFLGMLGNRYGWSEWIGDVDENILEDKKYSWIKEHTNVSITEIEIISALERDQEHNRAFIYLKEGENDNQKLTNLKNRLIDKSNSDKRVHISHYKDGTEFRDKTIESFTKALDELYPKDEKISEVEKLRISHQIFAKSRQKIYISHSKNELILNEFIKSNQDRLLLYGESGLGKSALIANYFDKFKNRSDSFVIEHYIGGAGELSNDLHQMLRRIMLEIKEEFELEDKVPSEPQKIMDEFALWLHRVKRPTVIVLDGYNQIEDELKEKLFYYIPEKLEHVKLIITSIKKSYPINNSHQIEPLTQEEQRVLVVDYLKGYGKTIERPILSNIIEHPQTTNTLFLRTLLNEIRLLGNFDNLQSDIENYLNSKDVVELFIKIFERLESDYRENLAKEVLSLLYVSRDGLSEDNLMEIINQNTTKELTRLEFSPLFLAIEEHLINRGGLYGFFHDFIRLAVKNRYLREKELVDGERRKIADYFEGREIDNQRVRELPFQLFELGDRDRLYALLIEIEFFIPILEMEEYKLLKYVSFLDENKDKYDPFDDKFDDDFIDKLLELLTKFEKNIKTFSSNELNKISFFFASYGKFENAILLLKKIINLKEKEFGKEHANLIRSYGDLGAIYSLSGDYDKAKKFHEKALDIKEMQSKKDFFSIAISYSNKANNYFHNEKNLKKAEEFYKKSIHLKKKYFNGNYLSLATTYNNLANLYWTYKNYQEAEYYSLKDIEICEKILGKEHVDMATSYVTIAFIYKAMEKYDKAEYFLEEALSISKRTKGNEDSFTLYIYDSLTEMYTNLAEDFNVEKKYVEAELFYLKSINVLEQRLEKELKKEELYDVKTSHKYDNYDDFMEENTKNSNTVYRIKIGYTEIGIQRNINSLIKLYDKLSAIYYANERYKELEKIYIKVLNIYILRDSTINIATAYHNLAGIYESLKEYDKSEYNYKKAIALREQYLGIEDYDTATSYHDLSITYLSMNRFNEAFNYMKKAIDIWIEILPKTDEVLIDAQKLLSSLKKIQTQDLKDYSWKTKKHKKMYETFFKYETYQDYFSWYNGQQISKNSNWDISFLNDKLRDGHFFMEEESHTDRFYFYQLLFKAFFIDIKEKKLIYDHVQKISISDIDGLLKIYQFMTVLEMDIEEAQELSEIEIIYFWAKRESEVVELIELILDDYDNIVSVEKGMNIEMVRIPKGHFIMGEEDSKKEVIIEYEFELGESPITIGEYMTFVEETQRHYPEWLDEDSDYRTINNYKKMNLTNNAPVIGIDWYDAVAYCKWLSKKTNKNYRLPTEIEWEYACRAGTTTKWSFGNNEKELDKYAWYKDNSNGTTHIVKGKKSNKWGLYDMHGNVWEWCADWYDENENRKVIRGGSEGDNSNCSCSTYRVKNNPINKYVNVGFRILRFLS